MGAASKGGKAAVKAKTAIAKKPPLKRAAAKKPARQTGQVLSELKSLAIELNKAAKGLGKTSSDNPKEVAAVLGNVERMTADAANKSLLEAETAKHLVAAALESLNKDWSRKDLEASLRGIGGHLTNIMVAQEFQDLAGQALRKAMKALVGAIIVVESGGPTDDKRLSQKEVDSLLKDLAF